MAFCLAACGLVLYPAVLSSASALPQATPSHSSESDGAVFVDEAMRAKSTRRSGFAPYTTHNDTLDGTRMPHSLITEVSAAKPSDTLSVLTLKIDGKYERFRATVGRSDEEARSGPAYVYFEVWGDGTCFFRSTPIRSAATMVTVAPGAPTRKTPQAIDIIVRGTRTLQLVTRFATLEQQAPGITRARGCVWGDPRLLPPAAERVVVTTPTVKIPVEKIPVPPPVVSNPIPPKNSSDPRRDGVRMAILRLAASLGNTVSPDTAQPVKTGRYPLKVALLPLRPWGASAKTGIQSADAAIQKLLASGLPSAKRGKESVFTLANPEDALELAKALPVSLAQSSTLFATSMASLAALCRTKEIDAVLVATLVPGPSKGGRSEARLELILFDAESGTQICQSFQTLAVLRKN